MSSLKAQVNVPIMTSESSEDKLASLISMENLDAVSKLVSIAKRLNELGLLDLVNDLLSDEEFLREVFNQLLTTDNVVLLANMENLVKLLAKLSDRKMVEQLTKLLTLLGMLSDSGLVDSMGALLSNGDAIKAMQDLVASIGDSLPLLSKVKLSEAVKAAVESVKAGESVSVVALLRKLMTDPNVKRGLLFIVGFLEGVGKQLSQ
ncbi:MAG: DUF1641 domain-containing protein [Caldivirga sp.]|jgi:uncharacterized protein YjgD (DUF1641 family)|uniref:DUF1641 domain-containing protein n=1 Tax=Caldivirga sp. MU80 TaxID=1650354 RepID=UPI000A04EB37|nr:DUF1641 domain-containing protein [Caldivirga sp. MU80]